MLKNSVLCPRCHLRELKMVTHRGRRAFLLLLQVFCSSLGRGQWEYCWRPGKRNSDSAGFAAVKGIAPGCPGLTMQMPCEDGQRNLFFPEAAFPIFPMPRGFARKTGPMQERGQDACPGQLHLQLLTPAASSLYRIHWTKSV